MKPQAKVALDYSDHGNPAQNQRSSDFEFFNKIGRQQPSATQDSRDLLLGASRKLDEKGRSVLRSTRICMCKSSSDPAQRIGNNLAGSDMCAFAMGNYQAFWIPGQPFVTSISGQLPSEETCSPLARCTAVLSDQAIHPHQPSFPADHFRFGVALGQIADDCTAGLAMKENDLLHGNRTMEYHLVCISGPGRICLVA